MIYASYKKLDLPEEDPFFQPYLAEYYHIKTLQSLGVVVPYENYSPNDLEVFCRIEQEFKKLENQTMVEEIKAKRGRGKRRGR